MSLPKEWTTTTLEMITLPFDKCNPKSLGVGQFRYVDIEALDNRLQKIATPKCLSNSEAPSRARQVIKAGDTLFSLVRPYLKNIALVPEELDDEICSTAYCVLRPCAGIDSKFLFYQIVQESYIHSVPTYGNSPPSARDDEFLSIKFLLPPLNEQGRIVAKIEELFSELDAGVAALERVKTALGRYRASVLKAAVEGRLTAEWRANHADVEPASELLERILVQRRQQWEADQLQKFQQANKQPPKNWQSKYKEPTQPDTSDLPELPGGWCWASLDMISDITGGITKGQQRKTKMQTRAVPYLRVANVQRGFLNLNEIKAIEAPEDEIQFLKLSVGDILFTEGGDRDKLGRGWVWNNEIDECIHQNHVFRARLIDSRINSRLLSHWGNTFGRLWFMREGKQSVNLASINITILKKFPVPIPPIAEQDIVMSTIEERLSVVDFIESQLEANLKRAARLRQSILKRAFEGKLVPQDPFDEPAEMLLQRIREQREQVKPKPRTSKKNSTMVDRDTIDHDA